MPCKDLQGTFFVLEHEPNRVKPSFMSLFNRVGKLISGKILEARNHEVQPEIAPEIANPGEFVIDDSQNIATGIEDFSHRRGTMSPNLDDIAINEDSESA